MPKFILPTFIWHLLSGIPLSHPLHSFLPLVATIVTFTSMESTFLGCTSKGEHAVFVCVCLVSLSIFPTVPSKLLQVTKFHYFIWQNIFGFASYTFATGCFIFSFILWMLISHQMDSLRILPATLGSRFYLCSCFFKDMIPFIYFCFSFPHFVCLIKKNPTFYCLY